jgi:chromosome segregation ATPase
MRKYPSQRPTPTERIRQLENELKQVIDGRTSRVRASIGIDECLDQISSYKKGIQQLETEIAERARGIKRLSVLINDRRVEKERLLRRLEHESHEAVADY